MKIASIGGERKQEEGTGIKIDFIKYTLLVNMILEFLHNYNTKLNFKESNAYKSTATLKQTSIYQVYSIIA